MRTAIHCVPRVIGRLAAAMTVSLPVLAADFKPADLDALLASHGLTGARVGYHAEKLENSRDAASRAADETFIPASTAKFVTAAAALGILGADFKFRTSVHAAGEVRDGTLYGDLYLRGTGDPVLAVQDLMGLARQMKRLGLKRIEGRLRFDQSHLPHITVIAPGQPANAPYNAGVSALSLDFNRVRVHWRVTGGTGIEAQLSPSPGMGRVTATPAESARHDFRPDLKGGPESWLLAPDRIGDLEGYRELPVRNPGRRTAMVFRELAAANGIAMPPPEPGVVPPDTRELVGVDSLPLARLIHPALDYSNNVVSELIGLAAARRLGGKPASLAQSSRRLLDWLAARTTGLDRKGLKLPNHSGLSAAARITPRQMLTIVRHALGQGYGPADLLSLLPAGGWRDSLGSRFQSAQQAGRVWAKSGSLHYASGLVGVYFKGGDRRPAAFALFVMDDQRRAAYDNDSDRESPAAQLAAKIWTSRAKAFEEDLVRTWIDQR